MSEEAELHARIAALAGQINKHKRQPPSLETASHSSVHNESHHPRGGSRWKPYLQSERPKFKPVKNRTLVIAKSGPNSATASDSDAVVSPYMTSRAGSKAQLLTKETYEREQHQRKDYQQERAVKAGQPAPQPARRRTHGATTPNQVARILEFDGIKFELQSNGAKLIRLPDPGTAERATPKKVTIAEVDFLRTKGGNLVRVTTTTQGDMRVDVRASQKQCEKFTRYGTCPFGPSCRHGHDPSKIAICKEFFAKGSCPAGKGCDLSHEPNYHRVPACTYYLRGNCTNSACRYAHVVNVPPSALVCRAFATLGYCTKGVECGSRHVFECPEYTNHGHCAAHQRGLCALPHVDRASTLRKVAKRRGKAGSENDSDLSSAEEEQMKIDELDDDSEIDINMGGDDSHELTQQQDYISFGHSLEPER